MTANWKKDVELEDVKMSQNKKKNARSVKKNCKDEKLEEIRYLSIHLEPQGRQG